jgi:hypothetical protein
MNNPMVVRRGGMAEIATIHQPHPQTPEGRIPRHADPVDAAADDDNVKNCSAQFARVSFQGWPL